MAYKKEETESPFIKLELDLNRALNSGAVQHHDMIEAMLIFVDEIKNIKKRLDKTNVRRKRIYSKRA